MGQYLPLTIIELQKSQRKRHADFLRYRKQLLEARKAKMLRQHNAGQLELLGDIEAVAILNSRSESRTNRSQ